MRIIIFQIHILNVVRFSVVLFVWLYYVILHYRFISQLLCESKTCFPFMYQRRESDEKYGSGPAPDPYANMEPPPAGIGFDQFFKEEYKPCPVPDYDRIFAKIAMPEPLVDPFSSGYQPPVQPYGLTPSAPGYGNPTPGYGQPPVSSGYGQPPAPGFSQPAGAAGYGQGSSVAMPTPFGAPGGYQPHTSQYNPGYHGYGSQAPVPQPGFYPDSTGYQQPSQPYGQPPSQDYTGYPGGPYQPPAGGYMAPPGGQPGYGPSAPPGQYPATSQYSQPPYSNQPQYPYGQGH